MAALASREDRIRAGEDTGAIRLERVEGAGSGEALDDALVDGARADAGREIRKRGEQPLLAFLDDLLDRLRPNALEGCERIIDRVLADLEGRPRAVDVGRLDLDAEPLRLGTEFGELVGVVQFQRHRR